MCIVNISAQQCSAVQCKAGAAGFQLCFLIKPNSPLVVNMSGKFQPEYSAVDNNAVQCAALYTII